MIQLVDGNFSKCSNNRKQPHQGLQTFLSENHTSYYATLRGPDILRNVIVLGYV